MKINENLMLLTSFAAYFGIAFVWPTLRVWRATGNNPYVLPGSDDACGFVSRCMKVLIGALLAYLVMQLAWPHANTPNFPRSAALSAVGWFMLAVAITWTVAAQYQMGKSWRIGIDTATPTELVTTGLFARSRNPIFLAMRVCLFALLLIQPNALTLAFLVAGDLVMQFQVRLEEAFLRQQHGDTYNHYCARVGRW